MRIYVSTDKVTWQELNVGVSEDPYRPLDKDGNKIFSESGSWISNRLTILHARWGNGSGLKGEFSAVTPFLVYPSPDWRFVIVVFLRQGGYGEPEYPPPHNALVLNADGSVRHRLRQPARYEGQKTEFLYARWYEQDSAPVMPPWWAFWHRPVVLQKSVRMKMLIGWEGDPNCTFEALDFDPASGEFGEKVDSGRL